MPTAPLLLATETDTATVLGRSVTSGTLPVAVDTSLPVAVETDTIPEFTPVASATLYPGPEVYPGADTLPDEPDMIYAANTAIAVLPSSTETDEATTSTPLAVRPVPTGAETDMGLPLVDLVTDAEFAEAIADADRTPVYVVKADWNRSGLYDHPLSDLTNLVTEVTVERSLAGELPSEVGLVDGYASASLSTTLEGRWAGADEAVITGNDGGEAELAELDPVDVFAPYRSDSPLYGRPMMQAPITLDYGFLTSAGPELRRRFTGTVSRIAPKSAARSVELDALDPAHRLRATVTVPGTAIFEDILAWVGPDQYRTRINTQWIIDRCLRANGIYASPPPRPDAILSVTGHGALIPEVGWGGAPTEYFTTYRGPMWTPGAFGMLALAQQMHGHWWVQQPITAAPGTGFGFSLWMYQGPGVGLTQELMSFDISTDASMFLNYGVNAAGRPFVGFIQFPGPATGTVTLTSWPQPAVARWTFTGVHVSFGATTMTVRFRIDGQVHTGTVNIPTRPGNWKPDPTINYTWSTAFMCLQLWQSATPPGAGAWQGENWIPQADIDPGSNELTGLPDLVGVDTKELINEITATEGARFEFTPDEARPQWRTRAGDELRDTTATITEVITADRNLADLASVTDEASVRNIINIKTRKLTITDWQDYYVSPSVDAFNCPANSTTYFNLELPTAAYQIPAGLSTFGARPYEPWYWNYLGGSGFIYYFTGDKWADNSKDPALRSYIRVQITRQDFPDTLVGTAVFIRVIRLTPWRMQVIIGNFNAYPIRFATPATKDPTTNTITSMGEPALIIPARIVEQGEEQLEVHTDQTSIDLYGPSAWDVGGASRWCQDPERLRPLATSILAATSHPVPVLDAINVPHDPRRELRQRVLLTDPDGLGTVSATIVGISTHYSSEGARDQLTLRPIAPPGLGLLDDPTLGVLDASLVLS